MGNEVVFGNPSEKLNYVLILLTGCPMARKLDARPLSDGAAHSVDAALNGRLWHSRTSLFLFYQVCRSEQPQHLTAVTISV